MLNVFETLVFSFLDRYGWKEVDQFHQPSGSNEVAIANEDGISYGSELIEVDKVKVNQGDLLFGGLLQMVLSGIFFGDRMSLSCRNI